MFGEIVTRSRETQSVEVLFSVWSDCNPQQRNYVITSHNQQKSFFYVWRDCNPQQRNTISRSPFFMFGEIVTRSREAQSAEVLFYVWRDCNPQQRNTISRSSFLCLETL
jgi:hypothetical protein